MICSWLRKSVDWETMYECNIKLHSTQMWQRGRNSMPRSTLKNVVRGLSVLWSNLFFFSFVKRYSLQQSCVKTFVLLLYITELCCSSIKIHLRREELGKTFFILAPVHASFGIDFPRFIWHLGSRIWTHNPSTRGECTYYCASAKANI